MTDPRLQKDLTRLLAALEEGPKTGAELSAALHLNATRIRSLLLHLQTQGKVHAPHFVATPKGRSVNLWELRHSARSIATETP